MSKLKIPSENATQLYQEQSNEAFNGLRFVAKEFIGEWRWGTNYQLVVQDVLTEKYYSTIVQEQTGDNYYLSLEDFDEVSFEEVVPVEIKTIEYRRPENDS